MSRYPEITIIGLGLIGSSLARAIKSKLLCDRLVLFDANAEVRDKAMALGLGDVVTDDIAMAVQDADLWSWQFLLALWQMLQVKWHRILSMGL